MVPWSVVADSGSVEARSPLRSESTPAVWVGPDPALAAGHHGEAHLAVVDQQSMAGPRPRR